MSETVEQLRKRAQVLRRQPEQTAERIDAINETAWKLRHADISLATKLSTESLQLAIRNNYARGRAFALRGLGVCQLRADLYQQAAATLLDSRISFANLSVSEDIALASTINVLAITQRYSGDHQAALENCFTAMGLCEKTNEQNQVAIICNNIAGIYSCSGNYATALRYSYQALQIYAESNKSVSEAWSYGNLSGILWRVGEAKTSIKYSQQSINLLREHQDRRNEAMARVNLGAAWQSLENYQKAADNYLVGLQIAEETNALEVQTEAHKCLGFLSLEKGAAEPALDYLAQALQLSRNINSLYNESETLLYLGLAYEQLGDEQKGAQMFEQALEISERLGLKEVRAKTHLALSKLFEKQNKLSAALFHYQNFHRFWQEVFGGASSRKIERLLLHKELRGAPAVKPGLQSDGKVPDQQSHHAGTALSPHKLRQVLNFINQHLDQNITLTALADVAALNYDHFIRSFKKATNQTPHQFLVEQRVERAKLLLQTTALPLAEIALRCGFNSQPHFTTQFRLSTGFTPHQFRQAA